MKQRVRILSLLLAVCLLLTIAGCAEQAPVQATGQPAASSTEPAAAGGKYTPGTYEGEGQGNNGPVKVSVAFDADSIVSVTVTGHSETAGISDPAIERIPSKIISGQTLNVDTVSGATNTSKAILEAVKSCVEQADGDVEALQNSAAPGTATGGQTIEKQADVLIIGGGAAGLTAANAALEQGAKNVILIEKMASLGGASALAGGLAGGCSELQKSYGLKDSPALIYEDIMRGGNNTNDATLVKLWSEQMGPVFDWLVNTMKVPIQDQFSNFPEHTVQRSYVVTGGTGVMIQVLGENFEKTGGQILLETKATELKMDGNTVIGVLAEDADGNTVDITAKATVLASGGFGNNPDMLSDQLSIALFYGAASSTGEGIKMAESIGAKLSFMDFAKMYPQGIEVSPGSARVATVHSMTATQKTGAIYVNKEGKRVIDENLDFVSIKNKTKEQTDHILFLVLDQAGFDMWSQLANDSASSAGRFTFEEQETWFNTEGGTPVFRRGTDLAQVAAAAGIDGAALKQTIDAWNADVKAGKDTEFGREELFPFATDGTYYIIEQKLRFATTLGGVTVNENLEVLDASGQPIPGFYAAGECVGGVHGEESMPTCMLSWAVTSGTLVGGIVASNVK